MLLNGELDGSIRSARNADLVAILELARSCGLLESGIAEAVERFSVVTVSGGVVGVCGLETYDHIGLLRTLGVDPQHRRLGFGRKLVEATLVRGRLEGIRTIYLLTTTAREFFARLGFEETLRGSAPAAIQSTWEFESGCPSSATLMLRAPCAAERGPACPGADSCRICDQEDGAGGAGPFCDFGNAGSLGGGSGGGG